MKSLSETPEHDKGLGWEGPGGDRAVRTLIASRRTLASETPTRKLPTRPSVTTHARHAPALPPVKLTTVTWNRRRKVSVCHPNKATDKCTNLSSDSAEDHQTLQIQKRAWYCFRCQYKNLTSKTEAFSHQYPAFLPLVSQGFQAINIHRLWPHCSHWQVHQNTQLPCNKALLRTVELHSKIL